MPSGRSSLFKRILVFGSLPALLAASYFLYPLSDDGTPLCWFKLAFGLPCMGCGLTRAFSSLAHGQFDVALHYHFLAPAVFVWIVLWYAFALIAQFKPDWKKPRWWGPAGNALVMAMMILYCGRMVMFFSHPKGLLSPVKHNMFARLIRWDWQNTYETYSR